MILIKTFVVVFFLFIVDFYRRLYFVCNSPRQGKVRYSILCFYRNIIFALNYVLGIIEWAFNNYVLNFSVLILVVTLIESLHF